MGRLVVGHFDHRLRRESAEEARFVADLAAELGLTAEVGIAERPTESRGDGMEAAAREARYRFLLAAARRQGARIVATAHTQDDQVETILLRILRGTGISGLRGIPRVRELDEQTQVLRPWLEVERLEVLEYLEAIGQAFRVDGSNEDRGAARNRIRHELLPRLRREYNGQVDGALLRLAKLAAEEQDCVAHGVERLKERRVVVENRPGETLVLDCTLLQGEHPHLVGTLLRELWEEQGWPQQGMGYEEWGALAMLADHPGRAGRANRAGHRERARETGRERSEIREFPGGVRACRSGGRLTLQRHAPKRSDPSRVDG